MRTKQIIPVLGLALSLLGQAAIAEKTTAAPSAILVNHLAETPQSLTAQLKKSLAKVRPACVGINIGGSASGVIISPDGHVLTVAHIARKYKPGNPLEVILQNGRVLQAKLLGFNRAPYLLAIRHALPLYAKDAGKPVFNENGQFIGMHIARFSRTIGLIIPLDQLKEQADQMMDGIK